MLKTIIGYAEPLSNIQNCHCITGALHYDKQTCTLHSHKEHIQAQN